MLPCLAAKRSDLSIYSCSFSLALSLLLSLSALPLRSPPLWSGQYLNYTSIPRYLNTSIPQYLERHSALKCAFPIAKSNFCIF